MPAFADTIHEHEDSTFRVHIQEVVSLLYEVTDTS